MLGVVVTGCLALTTTPAVAAPASSPSTADVIILLRPGSDVATEARAATAAGAEVSQLYTRAISGFAARVPEAALPGLRRNPRVLAVDPDAKVNLTGTQSTSVWGLDRIDQRSLPLSGSFTYPGSGTGVTSYVVDTGILAGHVEFGSRVRSGYTAIADGRGTSDCNGHGTHVAGTIAGAAYGVAKASELVAVRVLGCDGAGSVSGMIAALDWVIADHQAGAPAVANFSLGAPANSSLDAAVEATIADGITVIAAAGNSATDACAVSPARVPAALTIGASDISDARASFSNYGSCLDLFAPGADIRSAWVSGTTASAWLSGTSMAAPHAAGAAAVLLSLDASLSPAEVTGQLLTTATSGTITGVGTGSPNRLLHLIGIIDTAATAPAAPVIGTPRRGNTSAVVTWTPGGSGGADITGYDVQAFNGTTLVKTVAVTGAVSSATVTGLTNGKWYTFRVAAKNGVGTGPFSARSTSAVPATVPSRPGIGSARSGAWGGTVTAKIAWSVPATNGGSSITGYRVRALRLSSSGAVLSVTTSALQSASSRSLVMKLKAGHYRFQVLALNSVGRSTWSARSAKVTAR